MRRNKESTNVVEDREFGTVEFPLPPTKAEFERVAKEALARVKKQRLWPSGSISKCPNCGRRAFIGRDDLEREIPRTGGIVIFRNLRGARCESCHAQNLEPAEIVAIEEQAGTGFYPDYEAKVSRIGSGTMGTYWPKDVVRNLRLAPGKKAYIQILDRETMVVRFKGEGG